MRSVLRHTQLTLCRTPSGGSQGSHLDYGTFSRVSWGSGTCPRHPCAAGLRMWARWPFGTLTAQGPTSQHVLTNADRLRYCTGKVSITGTLAMTEKFTALHYPILVSSNLWTTREVKRKEPKPYILPCLQEGAENCPSQPGTGQILFPCPLPLSQAVTATHVQPKELEQVQHCSKGGHEAMPPTPPRQQRPAGHSGLCKHCQQPAG